MLSLFNKAEIVTLHHLFSPETFFRRSSKKDMATIIDEINQKLQKLDILDDLKVAIKSLISTCSDLEARQSNLESKIKDLSNENLYLKTQLKNINCEFDRYKQQALNSNLEIAGVPVTENESPVRIAETIFSHLGIQNETVIKHAYRKKTYKTRAGLPPTIIVHIENKGIRDQILKRKRQQTLDTSILDNSSSKRLLYINEHLTDFNKYIFKRAKDLRRCGIIVGSWVRNGYIIIKEKENSVEQRITCLSQLDELRH